MQRTENRLLFVVRFLRAFMFVFEGEKNVDLHQMEARHWLYIVYVMCYA